MRKFFSSLVLVVSLLAVMGCSNGLSGNGNIEERGAEIGLNDLSLETQAAVRKFGKVNRVYKAPVRERFYTGQVVTQDHFGMKLYFEAFVVEFDKLDSYIANYLTSIKGNNNALMHQNYGDIKFDTSKTYVEFATYKIYDPNKNPNEMKVFRYNTRTFSGDYINHLVWGNNGRYPDWYAKSVDFDPSMMIDLSNWKYIDPAKRNEQVNYEFPYETVSLGTKSINNTVDFTKYGTVSNIYQNKYAGVPTDYYLVEFSQVNNNFKEFIRFNSGNNNGEWIHDQNFKKPGTEEPINYNDAYFIEFYEQTEKDDVQFASKFWFREKMAYGHSPVCVLSKEELNNIDNFSVTTNEVTNNEIIQMWKTLGDGVKIYQNSVNNEPQKTYLIVYDSLVGKENIFNYIIDNGRWVNPKFVQEYNINGVLLPNYNKEDGKTYYECELLGKGQYKIRMLEVWNNEWVRGIEYVKKFSQKMNLTI